MTVAYLQNEVLPNEPTWPAHLAIAAARGNEVILHDPYANVKASYPQFWADVLRTRTNIRSHLSSLQDGFAAEAQYLCVLGDPGYEISVASFAITALGAGLVPLLHFLTPDTVAYLLRNCQPKILLYQSSFLNQARAIQDAISQAGLFHLHLLPIDTMTPAPSTLADLKIHISSNPPIPTHWPSYVCFSSGSTGIPKGLVHNRRFLYPKVTAPQPGCGVAHRALSWAAGAVTLLMPLLQGQTTEVIHPDAHPKVYWDLIRENKVTYLLSTLVLWNSLSRYYQDVLAHLPAEELEPYLRGARKITEAYITGSVPTLALLKQWKEIKGTPPSVAYASSELGAVTTLTDPNDDLILERCIGKPVPLREIKLSEGDYGEMLVKAPLTVMGYLNNEKDFCSLFDEDGFYKTGDVAHLVGEQLIYDGRSSIDFVKVIGIPVHIISVEQEIMKLPYIIEAHVMPVPDRFLASRVGVLARFEPSATGYSLENIRDDLANILPPYQLPTVLRVLQEGESVEVTESRKIAKKQTMEKYFPVNADLELLETVEIWEMTAEIAGNRSLSRGSMGHVNTLV